MLIHPPRILFPPLFKSLLSQDIPQENLPDPCAKSNLPIIGLHSPTYFSLVELITETVLYIYIIKKMNTSLPTKL